MTRTKLWLMFVGTITAVAVAVSLTLLPKEYTRDILVVLIGSAGGLYFGVSLLTPSPKSVALHIGMCVIFLGLALAGLWVSPLFLALAWFIHAAWDVITEHPKALNTPIKSWYVPLCLSFDILVGVFILIWWIRVW